MTKDGLSVTEQRRGTLQAGVRRTIGRNTASGRGTVGRGTFGRRATIAAAACALAIGLIAPGAAVADPVAAPPMSPIETLQHLADLSRQSEELSESVHNAQIDLDAKLADQRVAQDEQAQADRALADANARVARYQPTIDRLVVARYTAGESNRMSAILTSHSPQQLLDQMSLLDEVQRNTAASVSGFVAARADAVRNELAAREKAERARTAVEVSRSFGDQLLKHQTDLQKAIGAVTTSWAKLTTAQQHQWAGFALPPGFDLHAVVATLPNGPETGAVLAGITRLGRPYVWGATGPDQFDCSGLMVWAYKQVGRTLPRSSEAQMAAGKPVDRKDLQPGDLIGYYSDASHVGMYIGDGMVLHASTFGVPVAIKPIDQIGPFYGARRY